MLKASFHILAFAGILASSFFLAGASASSASAPKLSSKTSMILCPPGYVYRCNQYGCFCVKA
jgi:hypothetical protein